MKREIFEKRLNEYEIKLVSMKKKSNIFGVFRLLSILISFVALYFYYSESGSKNIILLVSCIFAMIIFVYCVKK